MTELELKFAVPAAMQAPLRQALRQHGAQRLRLRAHYFDTAGGDLARHRVALRLRLEGRRWVQTLKAAGEGAVHRLEHEVPVPGPSHRRPALDMRRHEGSAAAPLLAAALKGAADATLVEQHATDVWRLRCDFFDAGGTHVEAAFDVGHALAAGRRAPIVELELEHKGGPVQGLFDLASACVRHGGLWQSTVTKAERGQRLRQPDAPPPATRAQPPQLAAGADAPALMRASLQAALQQVLANASEVAAGAGSDEAVHQLRVGLRRLRVLLRELAPLSPAIAPGWQAALAVTAAKLGAQRDAVAVVAAVRPLLEAAALPVPGWPVPADKDPGAAVRDAGFQLTLLAIQALAHAGAGHFAPLSPAATRRGVARRLQRLYRQLQRDGSRFDKLPPAQQHRARKRLKRLRYLAEFTLALWPRRDAKPLCQTLSQAQDALGLHQDLSTAAATFRRAAAADPDAAAAAAWLRSHGEVTACAARQALKNLGREKPFWRQGQARRRGH